jgi:hypothetical protein
MDLLDGSVVNVALPAIRADAGGGHAARLPSGDWQADLLERVLDILAGHPAGPERKLEAFALLNALTALFAQNEQAAADTGAHRRLAYLGHVAAAGTHPRITAVLASLTGSKPHDQFDETILRTLSGVLG